MKEELDFELLMEHLQESYQEDLKINDELLDKQSIMLPQLINKYQVTLHKLLQEITDLEDTKKQIFHTTMYNYRIGDSDLASIDWNSSDLKKIIETSVDMREVEKKISNRSNDLRLVEEMINTIRNMGFNIKNWIDYKKIISGGI